MTAIPTTPNTNPDITSKLIDGDLVKQAVPGHGVPSQDPSPAAQQALTPAESEREFQSAFMGGGTIAGIAAGAAVGVAVGGPVGALVGGTAGAVAGAFGGAAVGRVAEPKPAAEPVSDATTPVFVNKA